MTWLNTRRAKNKANNRRRHHQTLINAAVDDRQKLWAVCHWLLAEALNAAVVPEAIDHLTAYIDQITEGEATHDHDYAA